MARSRRERGKRHSPEQIVRKLREADAMFSAGKSVGEVLQQLGVSEPTYHRWRMLIVRFRDGTLVKVHNKPKHEDRFQQFSAKLTEAGLARQSIE